MAKGKLIVISGFSGSGKGTVVNGLRDKFNAYVISISATTREPRVNEEEGVHYFFKTEEEFEEMIKEDGFIEYAQFVEHSYGTPKKFVFDNLETGKNVILEIEVQGALKVKEKYPEAIMIFILPPSALELKNRLVSRNTEKESVIMDRLRRAVEESDYVNKYDHIVINDDLNKCISDIDNIVRNNVNVSNDAGIIDKFKDELKEILKGE
jgi:guanylate kinase